MSMIQNPILKGFNPDPSILRVGDDYYIATSTFEWFPGVQIHHSKDLVNWALIAHPLNRVSQLDMLGTPDSTGVWAPCLSYDNGVFYLIYSNVKNSRRMKDSPNYLVTTTDIRGDWSEPIYMNCSGFDPSLFHDDDGRKWFVNMKWGTLHDRHPFAGTLLQEYDPLAKKLVGPIKNICKGSSIRYSEGPHLYKKDGYYYLMLAEGGTGYNHAVTLFRSKTIDGDYELHPSNPIVTGDVNDMYGTLQKDGHASLVETQKGEWYLVHLCARPLEGTNRCILGRETAIQKMEWHDDGWLYMAMGGNIAKSQTPYPNLDIGPIARNTDFIDNFDSDTLGIHWNSLRIPANKVSSLSERKGFLRLYGKESLESTFTQSLIARRQQSFVYTADTKLHFKPETELHMAGLVCYYNTTNYYYLRVTYDEAMGKYCLGVLASQNCDLETSMSQDDNIFFDQMDSIELKVSVDYKDLQFYYRVDSDSQWTKIGPVYDASTLSDDFVSLKEFGFTGAYVGLCCQDLAFGNHPADFEYFNYSEL